MDLYHADIRLPDYDRPPYHVDLKWSRHAERARLTDRYGVIPSFSYLNFDACEVIEVGMENDVVRHFLLRIPMDERDIVIALAPVSSSKFIVKTVWYNLKSDKHYTLDRSKYVR